MKKRTTTIIIALVISAGSGLVLLPRAATAFDIIKSNGFETVRSSAFKTGETSSYENLFMPISVGNYWVYKRPGLEGFTLLREEITGKFDDHGSACYHTKFTKTVHTDEDDPGSLFVEGTNTYCYVGGSVFSMCVRCEREKDSEPYWYTNVRMDDPTTIVLKLPQDPKIDQYWVDMPYQDQLTRYTVLGVEDVCMHELGETFENCIKVRRDVSFEPRLDGFDWFCPKVGLVKSEYEQHIKNQKPELMRRILVEYHVR